MKKSAFSVAAASAAVMVLSLSVYAESISVDMQDAGYGINGGASFAPEGIVFYESTLGELSEMYDTIAFTISAADLGGRDDLTFQVYVSADNWAVWANGAETPPITEVGTDYTFSLDLDSIAAEYGADKIICDCGFQIMSGTAGIVEVTYDAVFTANGSNAAATENTDVQENTAPASAGDKSSPDTGAEGIALIAGAALCAAAVGFISRKKR